MTLCDIPFRLKNSVGVPLNDGGVLVFGGWDEKHTMKTVFRLSFDACFTSYRIDLESILPYNVEGHSCAINGDHVYVVGGYDGISVTNKILRYSISNKTSEVIPARLSTARENHVCEIVFGRYMLVVGGWDGKKALNSVEVFELAEEYPYLIPTDLTFELLQARIRPASIVF
ncbi:kelch repeat protein [Dictyocaulus viviparus]|uniref:Kelch repeat protein n=1 Tax=Dictyocaulus viviparus TaxID=29172 RepID=A0A0D8XC85_DICVI|nr:kelch repeat protein [Dictyocaulus viviparus]